MTDCSFCGNAIEAGTGLMFVKRDGAVFHFCARKCKRNHDMGRSNRQTKWTKAFVKGGN